MKARRLLQEAGQVPVKGAWELRANGKGERLTAGDRPNDVEGCDTGRELRESASASDGVFPDEFGERRAVGQPATFDAEGRPEDEEAAGGGLAEINAQNRLSLALAEGLGLLGVVSDAVDGLFHMRSLNVQARAERARGGARCFQPQVRR